DGPNSHAHKVKLSLKSVSGQICLITSLLWQEQMDDRWYCSSTKLWYGKKGPG
ncbi:hypothetical protein SK128_027261, partial [Halocaridina rubra]